MFILILTSGFYLSVFLGIFIVVLCSAFCWYQWNLIKAYSQFPSKRLDTKWILPILTGTAPKNVPETCIILQELIKVANSFLAEGLCVVWFLRPYILVYSEEFTKTLVNETALANKASLYDVNNLMIGNGLIGSKHEVWKVDRKFLNPVFKLSVLKVKMRSFNAHAHRLVDKLQTAVDKPTDDVLSILKHCTFHIMIEVVLGLQMKNEKQERFVKETVKAVDLGMEQFILRMSRPWLYWNSLLPFFPTGRKYLESVNDANRLMRTVIKELIETYVISEKNGHQCADAKSAGDILVKRHLQDPSFTEQDVRDHLLTFVVGGYDTVSVTMMWCFYLLGHHQNVQDKAYNEVQSVLPYGDLSYEDISNMKYLDCVIKETLRLYTTGPFFGRKASKEFQCGKYTIPKGAEVIFFPFMLHRNPNIYTEPKKFDPERFADGSKIRPWIHLPFSEGYRSCIGKKFAMMEMKVLLAHVLRRFKITALNRIDDSELDWHFILKPPKPLRFLFETRHTEL